MKDFKINKDKKHHNKKDCYEIVVNFMEGDADGYEQIKFVFEKSKLEDHTFKKYVSDFIDSIESCINLDNKGRIGLDNIEEVVKWYGYGRDRCRHNYGGDINWGRFCVCRNQLDKKIEDSEEFEDLLPYQEKDNFFSYEIPNNEWYTSYDRIDMYYYDNEGVKFDVDIE